MTSILASKADYSEVSLHDLRNDQEIKSTIIVPVFNEERGIGKVLQEIISIVDETYEVLVIDDGSSDDTRKIVNQYPCRLISHGTNLGKGAAIQTGIKHSRGKNIILIDGDATYPAEAIPLIVAKLEESHIVRCVRKDGRNNIPFINRWGNLLFDKAISVMCGIEGTDFMTGLYGARKSVVMAINLEANGFDIETEIAIKAKAMNLKNTIIPVQYHQRLGQKKLKPFQDGTKILSRMAFLALTYNPIVSFILPGIFLWLIAIVGMVGLTLSPSAMLHPNSFIVGAMAFLSGFQLIVFGYETALYMNNAGLGKQNRLLTKLAEYFPMRFGVSMGLILILSGGVWSFGLAIGWVNGGFRPFLQTQNLILSWGSIVLGIQMLSTMLFISLFNDIRKRTKNTDIVERDA